MSDDKTLEEIRHRITAKFERVISDPLAAYYTSDTIPYFLMKILDRLEEMDSKLEAIRDDLDDE